MKKIILATLTISFAIILNAQVAIDSANTQKIDSSQLGRSYVEKSKIQKTMGIMTAVTGGIVAFIGLAIIEHDNLSFEPHPTQHSAGPILTVTGGVIMLGSIPLFIASKKNEHKAELYLSSYHAMIAPKIKTEMIYSVGVRVQL